MKIPENENSTIALIDKQVEKLNKEKPRLHLGASLLGNKCDRALWLQFHWVVNESFSGRMLRLFKVGHEFEPQIINQLRSIGVDIRSSQDRVDFGKHVSGSVDGIIYSGLPEAPSAKHVFEAKTHGQKSFDALLKEGVQKSKPLHYIQMQVYMHGLKIDRALYIGINKNTSELYQERIELDKPAAIKAIERGQKITMSERMPVGLSDDPTYFECRFCSSHEFCHKTNLTKEVNCRTCAFSTAKEDSTWHCGRWDDVIPNDVQYVGCDSHVLHPDLVPFEIEPAKDEWHAVYVINGKPVLNGADGYLSSEIVANSLACSEEDPFVKELRKTMGARIIENDS